MKDETTVIDFLRHGECEGGDIFRGSGTDVSLTDLGWQQMVEAVRGRSTGCFIWSKVISSPLIRCRQFAQNYAASMNIPLEVNPDLREVHFGVWEGRPISDIWQQSPELATAYFNNPQKFTPVGGEPIEEVRQRLETFWDEIIARCKGQNILLIQHGGTIRLLLTLLLKLPIPAMNQFEVPYASLTRIKVFHQGDEHYPVLVSHNEKGFRQ